MKDKELKELVASLAIGQKETDKQLRETDKQLKETDKQLKLMAKSQEKSQQKTDEQMQKTDKKLAEVAKMVGGIGNSNGDVAEEYFFRALSNNLQIANFKFDSVDKNVTRKTKDLQDEFDIVLINSNSLVITEVKYKFLPESVDKVKVSKIPNFRTLFSKYKDYKIYGAIAGFSLPKKTIEKAKDYGFFVLSQQNDKLEILNKDVVAY